jgi:hypothetical protein
MVRVRGLGVGVLVAVLSGAGVEILNVIEGIKILVALGDGGMVGVKWAHP